MSASVTRYIYTLTDPCTGFVRYVGLTGNIDYRRRQHVYQASAVRKSGRTPCAKDRWILFLHDLGLSAECAVIEVVEGRTAAIQSERDWIYHFRQIGVPILNETLGGDLPRIRQRSMESIREGLFNRCSPEPMSGCWLWLGPLNHKGYGPHRKVYKTFKGKIPNGLHLDHKCRVRCCVNPDHLEPVTLVENVKRGNSGIFHRSKTHCPKGHPYDEINTGHYSDGKYTERYCIICRNFGKREARRKRGAKPRMVTIVLNGEAHYLRQWERITGILHSTITRRINRGWSIERALSVPTDAKKIRSEEANAKASASNRGKKRTEEQRAKMRLAQQRRFARAVV